MIQSVVVFCASSSKIDPCYFEAAEHLGKILAENKICCCNGAGRIGLMAALSASVLKHGGKVTGVIPQFMCDMNWCHSGLSDLHIVDTMHERKFKMSEIGDAVVAMPGGCGTVEELMEVITWKQLGLYLKPIVILNTKGFYTPLLDFLQHSVDEKFMRIEHQKIWCVVETPEEVLPAILNSEQWDTSVRKIAAI